MAQSYILVRGGCALGVGHSGQLLWLSWDVVSPKPGISPQLLIQQNIFLCFPWLSAAVISCKVPPGPFLCRDFGRAAGSLPCSTLLLVQPGLWCVCGGSIQGIATVFSPEISPFNPHNAVKRAPCGRQGSLSLLWGSARAQLSPATGTACFR